MAYKLETMRPLAYCDICAKYGHSGWGHFPASKVWQMPQLPQWWFRWISPNKPLANYQIKIKLRRKGLVK